MLITENNRFVNEFKGQISLTGSMPEGRAGPKGRRRG
jgi:hypothetical protein